MSRPSCFPSSPVRFAIRFDADGLALIVGAFNAPTTDWNDALLFATESAALEYLREIPERIYPAGAFVVPVNVTVAPAAEDEDGGPDTDHDGAYLAAMAEDEVAGGYRDFPDDRDMYDDEGADEMAREDEAGMSFEDQWDWADAARLMREGNEIAEYRGAPGWSAADAAAMEPYKGGNNSADIPF